MQRTSTLDEGFNEEILTKMREGRSRAAESVNVSKIPKEDRQMGEIASRKDSIVWFCRSCVGYDAGGLGSVAANVRSCPAYHCPLWPWRNGSLDEDAKSTGGFGE